MVRDPNIDKLIREAKERKWREGEGKKLTDTFGNQLKEQFGPVLDGMGKELTKQIKEALGGLKMPDMPQMPEYKVPEIPQPIVNVEAPIVNVPAPVVNIPAPIVHVPETVFPEYPSEMKLKGVSPTTPLHVQMVDQAGKPMMFPVSGGISGGRGDFFTIKAFEASAFADLQNADGRIKVSVETGGSGLTDAELRATAVPVSQLSGASWSTSASIVSVSDIFSTTAASSVVNPDNRVRVELPTGSSGLTDTELRATAVPVSQVSGANWSVYAQDALTTLTATTLVNGDNRLRVSVETGGSGLTDSELRATAVPVSQVSGAVDSVFVVGPIAQGDESTAIRVVVAGNSAASVTATQTGTWNIGTVASVTASVAIVNLDRDGNPAAAWQVYPTATGLNETNSNVLRTVQMTDSVSSVVVNSGTLTGVTNTVTINQVSGASFSTTVVGPIAQGDEATALRVVMAGNSIASTVVQGAADSFFAYEAFTTNKTAKADGADIRPKADSQGRQITRPVQVRGLVATAYATTSTGIETTLLAAGGAGVFHDLIMLTATNGSTAAITVDIREVTAGNIVHTMVIPASTGPVGFAPAIPWPQSSANNNWTVDVQGADVSNTNAYFTALFSKEV